MGIVWALWTAQWYSSYLCSIARPPHSLRWPWQVYANELYKPACPNESLRETKKLLYWCLSTTLRAIKSDPQGRAEASACVWSCLDNSDGRWGLTETHLSQAPSAIHEVCAKACWELNCHREDWERSSRTAKQEGLTTSRAGPQINGPNGLKFGFCLASSNRENYHEKTSKLRERGWARVMELVSGVARIKPRPGSFPSLQYSHFRVAPSGSLGHCCHQLYSSNRQKHGTLSLAKGHSRCYLVLVLDVKTYIQRWENIDIFLLYIHLIDSLNTFRERDKTVR